MGRFEFISFEILFEISSCRFVSINSREVWFFDNGEFVRLWWTMGDLDKQEFCFKLCSIFTTNNKGRIGLFITKHFIKNCTFEEFWPWQAFYCLTQQKDCVSQELGLGRWSYKLQAWRHQCFFRLFSKWR